MMITLKSFKTSRDFEYFFAINEQANLLFYIVHLPSMVFVADYFDKPRFSKLGAIKQSKKTLIKHAEENYGTKTKHLPKYSVDKIRIKLS